MVAFGPGCVKTLGGITAPGILGSTVMRRAKKRKNLSSARHYDQIRFRFHTNQDPELTWDVQCNRLSGCRMTDVPAGGPPRNRYPAILPRLAGAATRFVGLKTARLSPRSA